MKSERTGRPTSAAAMVAAAASLEKARTRLEKTLTSLGRAAEPVHFQRRAPAATVFQKAMQQRPASAAWTTDAVNTSVPPLNPEPSRVPETPPRLALDLLVSRTAREQGLPPSAAMNVALQTPEGRALVARITGATK